MPAVKIRENIYSVGAKDYDIRDFHGYGTPKGSTYNAFLILDEKITLIDTVKAPFAGDLIENIRQVVDPGKIDYIISNHAEPDHSGATPAIADLAPNAVVICSPNDVKTMETYYKRSFNFKVAKTGDSLCTGKYNFEFINTPMVHWPDNMVTYLKEEKILFSNDAMGQHNATPYTFDDEIGLLEMLANAKNYYANIVLPFGVQVQKLLKDVSGYGIEMICPSHGIIWRSYIPEIVKKYDDWSKNKVDENLAVIIYETMWGNTGEMAKQIENEFAEKGIRCKHLHLKYNHISTCIDELMEAKYICVGSPTLNRNIMPAVASFLCYLDGLHPTGRVGLAFGSYGWSGESPKIIEEALRKMGYEMLETRKSQYRI